MFRTTSAPLEFQIRSLLYKFASWAAVGPEAPGQPAYDVIANQLGSLKRIKVDPRPRVQVV